LDELTPNQQIVNDPAELRQQLRAAQNEIGRARQHSMQEMQALRSELAAAARNNQARLSERFREIAFLTELLRQEEKITEATQARADWLRDLSLELMNRPAWWGVMPMSWQHKRCRRVLREKGLFDGECYLQLNPDVAESGMDPLFHYVFHGINEGRSRSM
jgi:hypothetical protein